MKRFKKILKWTGIILLIIIAGFTTLIFSRQNLQFDAPYPTIKASTDSLVLAKGKYLVYGPAHCADCHAPADKATEIEQGIEVPLTGGREFILPIGKLYSPNISSDKETGIGNFTDGEIARALRHGVGRDGRALFAFMPFQNTSEEDLTAIISYLRTTPAVNNKVPKKDLNFLGKGVSAFLIKPVGPGGEPVKSIKPDTTIEYGKYLANNVANCRGCHTNRDLMTGDFIGPDYAGGMHFTDDPGLKGEYWTPNLTFDKSTGIIADWTEQTFIERFKKGRVYPTSPMPWGPFKNFSETDLKALYRYLKSVPPVTNKIEKVFVPEKKAS
jgi:mono/diheme cytochrome c family protein